MDSLVIRQSWWPIVKGLAGSGAFMLLGIWFLKSKIDEDGGFKFSKETIAISLSTALFLVFTILYRIKALSKNKVLVELNKEGLHQGTKSIAWDDIDAFQIREYGPRNSRQKMIVFFLKESVKDKYPKDPLEKFGTTLTNADFDGGVNFELSGIPIEEMMTTLEKYRTHYTK